MNRIKSQIQNACRSLIRPLARVVRQALTPPEPPIEFDWHEIRGGPAIGAQALLPKDTAIAEAITSGTYEQAVMAVVTALVEEQDVCIDIGGHYGYFTLSLAKLARHGQVHTFEPVSAHVKRIRESVERSGLEHVTVHHAAVAGEVGEMTLQFAQDDSGDDSMAFLDAYGGVDTPAAHEHYRAFARTTVNAVTLDSLAASIPNPKLIKIDAEGAEGAILSAGGQLIHRDRPRLLVELHGIYEALQCAELLDRLNYRAILLTDQKVTMPILWVPREDHEAISRVQATLGRSPITLFNSVAGGDTPQGDPSPLNNRLP